MTMLKPTKENVRKASVIADFLNKIGYMPYLFFDTSGILRICRDELELYWWYYQALRAGRKLV